MQDYNLDSKTDVQLINQDNGACRINGYWALMRIYFHPIIHPQINAVHKNVHVGINGLRKEENKSQLPINPTCPDISTKICKEYRYPLI